MQEFCEGCEGEPADRPVRTIRRDAAYADNTKLPERFRARAGELIYARLAEGFEGETFRLPSPCHAHSFAEEVAAAVQALLDVFVANGYCLKAAVSDAMSDRDGAIKMHVKLEVRTGAIILWSVESTYS